MPLHKWIFEIASPAAVIAQDETIQGLINYFMDREDPTWPPMQYRIEPLTREEARQDFGLDDTVLDDWYETCQTCHGEIGPEREFNLDEATYEWLRARGVDTTGFVYDSEKCRLQHLRVLILQQERSLGV